MNTRTIERDPDGGPRMPPSLERRFNQLDGDIVGRFEALDRRFGGLEHKVGDMAKTLLGMRAEQRSRAQDRQCPDPLMIARSLVADLRTRAANPPMSTGDTSALINTTDFLAFLGAGVVPLAFAQLLALGQRVPLTQGRVTFAAQHIVAGWTTEAGTINMARPTLGSTPMGAPKKVTAMTSFTREMMRQSDIEQVVDKELRNACAEVLDSSLLDDQPEVPGERPAGLRSYNAALAAASDVGGAMDSVLAALLAAGAKSVVYITGLLEAQKIARQPGGVPYPVIASAEMPPQTLIGIDPTMFAGNLSSADIGTTDAPVVHEDSAALPLVDGAGVQAKPQRSGFQTGTMFTRAIFDANWTVAQGRVYWTTISSGV